MQQFSGTGVAVVTPFSSDYTLDTYALRKTINHLIDGKVEYLVVLGTTGESATLSSEEKKRVIDIFFEETDNRIPLVLGSGGNNTAEICKQVEYYTEKYRPAGILSVSPYYNKPSQEGIYQHYKAVAGSTDLPVILYNVPGRTSSNVLAPTTLRLAHDCSNIVAVKEASGNFEQFMEILRERPAGFQVLSGDDSISIPMISLGAEGTISVIANALPLEFSDMIRAALAGKYEEAREIHYRIFPFMQLIFREGNPVGIKVLMEMLGICSPTVRLPLVEGTAALREAIQGQLAATR
ncbi:MAG: 4-hydroxy-tetrahydrodipicolinate synthase [Bacteroidia bacterium]